MKNVVKIQRVSMEANFTKLKRDLTEADFNQKAGAPESELMAVTSKCLSGKQKTEPVIEKSKN